MSRYPWSGSQNENPYTDHNRYDQVGIQPLDIALEGDKYPVRPGPEDADASAGDVASIVEELNALSAGEILWVEEGVYDFSDVPRRQDLPRDATLASDGATIYEPEDKSGTFNLTNDGARITGLRMEGPEIGYTTRTGTSRAIMLRSDSRIDNCEIYGFYSSGLYVGEGGAGTEPSRHLTPHIHHCVIRDNQKNDLGYGIVTYNGDPLIEFTFFNNNRHSVAGSGSDWSSYQLYNSVNGPDGRVFQAEQHSPGGVRMDVRHNEFQMVETSGGNPARAYAQRGTPNEIAEIYNNWIHNPNEPGDQPDADSPAAIVQYDHGVNDWANVEFGDNHYGSDEPSDSTIGVQPLEGNPVGYEGFEGTTNAEGTVSTDVPDGEYAVVVTHPAADETVEGTVTVDGEDAELSLSFGR